MNTAALAARRKELQAVADLEPCVTRCAYCEWCLVGTLGEGRVAYPEHRRKEHNLPTPARRPKIRNLSRWTGSNLSKAERREIDAEVRRRARENGLEVGA